MALVTEQSCLSVGLCSSWDADVGSTLHQIRRSSTVVVEGTKNLVKQTFVSMAVLSQPPSMEACNLDP